MDTILYFCDFKRNHTLDADAASAERRMSMNVYPEIAKIAELNAEINRLYADIDKKINCSGFGIDCAKFVENCVEKDGHLYQDGWKLDTSGNVDNDYYCNQYTGYLGDDFWGTVYFATDKKGVFVAVPFSM